MAVAVGVKVEVAAVVAELVEGADVVPEWLGGDGPRARYGLGESGGEGRWLTPLALALGGICSRQFVPWYSITCQVGTNSISNDSRETDPNAAGERLTR